MRWYKFAFALAAITAPSWAHAEVLFTTSFESPDYTVGPLAGQDSWVNSFGLDPVVTSLFSQTGDQALEVRRASPNDSTFGLTFRPGPYTTAEPKVVVETSIYLAGDGGWEGDFVSPIALVGNSIGGPLFTAQLAIRSGETAGDPPDQSVPIDTNTWIDLKIVLDFPSQTAERFVDGVSLGMIPFGDPPGGDTITELQRVEIFSIVDTFNPFYIDDLSITAVPEPSSVLLAGFAAIAWSRRRR